MATTWTISTLERELSDGGVIVAHWRATDGFSPDASSPDFTPYDDLTESQVLGWCWANGVDKDAIEASLAAKIEAQKNPVSAAGVPW
jgi:hypothetical protein